MGEPDVALAVQVVQVALFWLEGGAFVYAQRLDAGEAEGFGVVKVGAWLKGGKVPGAVLVYEAVGLHFARLAAIRKVARVVVLHCGLQGVKVLGGDVFLWHGLHMQATLLGRGFELFEAPGQGAVRKELAHAGHVGVVIKEPGGDGAAGVGGKLPFAVLGALDVVGEALAEVALYGADANAELGGKLVLVKAGALVQEAEDVADTLREFFAFGGSAGRLISSGGGGGY